MQEEIDHLVHAAAMKRVSSHVSMASEAEINLDLSRLIIDKPRYTLERKRSFDEQSWSELSHRNNDGFDSVLQSPAFPSGGFDSPFSIGTHFGGGGPPHPLVNEAWEALRKSVVYFRGQPVGTIAAVDHASEEVLNYDQVLENRNPCVLWRQSKLSSFGRFEHSAFCYLDGHVS
jgi:hypothetical protein